MENKLAILLILIFSLWVDNFPQAEKIPVRGFVKDIKTNERISGAVILSGGKGVSLSDSSGYFKFSLSPGKYSIECRYIGYEVMTKDILLEKDDAEKELFFYMIPKPVETEKVTITGRKYKELEDFKTYELKSGDISNIPTIFEADAIKAVQALPGVTTFQDLSSLIYLRGGNFDETLIAIDGVPAYNLIHLGGVFGSVNPDIVEREVLYPSNYPVNYQGVLSGVLSINTKNGNPERVKGTGSVGLLSSKLYLEGPLSKGTFTLSARRTYPDLLFGLLKRTFPYFFYDLNGKYTLPLDDKNLLTFSGFYSKDIYKLFPRKDAYVIEKKDDLNWGNTIANLSYSHLFDKGELKTNIYFSRSGAAANAKGINYLRDYSSFSSREDIIKDSLNSIERYYINNSIKDITFRTELEYSLTGQELTSGLEYKNLSTNYFWDVKDHDIYGFTTTEVSEIFFDFAPGIFSLKDRSDIYSFYFSDKIQFTSSFNMNLGYRGSFIRKLKRVLSSPFISANFNLSPNIKLSASYGRYYEYLYTKKDIIGSTIYTPFATYFIGDNADKVPASDHFSIGLKIKDLLPDIRFEIEGYYKTRDNLIASDKLTRTTSLAQGYSGGVDALLRKDKGFLTGWASYSFSRAVKEEENYRYFASYDRTHNIKIMLNCNLSEKWELSAFWTYASGLPFTPVIGKFVTGYQPVTDFHENENSMGPVEIIYGRKNTYRHKNNHRLDIGITGNFIWGMFFVKPYLQILNVYNNPNPFSYEPNGNNLSIEDGAGSGSMIIPTVGLTLEF